MFCLDDASPRRFRQLALLTALLGVAFIVLKGLEWHEDFDKHLFPGPGFSITGPESGGAQLFYSFYFMSTALHAIHMSIGIALVIWIAARNPYRNPRPTYRLAAEAVGLYWSFVDLVWLVLYPLIYLIGRTP
jgi:cytochrome c oxidase subunit 3